MATETLPLVSSRTALSIVFPSFRPFLIFCFLRLTRTPAIRTDCSRQLGRAARLGEAFDLAREARQRVARDVEAERVLLALEPLVEGPVGLLREVVDRRTLLRRGAGEEVRLALLRLLADAARAGDDALRGVRQ